MSYGAQRRLRTRHKFLVYSGRFGSAAFQKMSELSVEFAQITYHEGGALIPHKVPGRATFADVTLERGSSDNSEFINWAQDVGNAATNSGLITDAYKVDDLAVNQQDFDNSLMDSWVLIGAFPVKYVAGSFDNETDEVNIESLTLAYDYFLKS